VRAGTVQVGTTRNIRARLHDLRHHHGPSVEIVQHWWCASEADAAAVAEVLEEGAADGTRPAQLIATAPKIAADLEIELAPADLVDERAREAVQAVETKLSVMRANGGLKEVNAEYRATRLRRAAARLGTMPYTVFLRRYAIGMLYQMAAEVRGRTR
jgi:hypothetical protein